MISRMSPVGELSLNCVSACATASCGSTTAMTPSGLSHFWRDVDSPTAPAVPAAPWASAACAANAKTIENLNEHATIRDTNILTPAGGYHAVGRANVIP